MYLGLGITENKMESTMSYWNNGKHDGTTILYYMSIQNSE